MASSIWRVYLPLTAFILSWWLLALTPKTQEIAEEPSRRFTCQTPAVDLSSLSSLKREDLKQALSGDFQLMARLIRDWEIDARILKALNYKNIQTLSPRDYLESQLLERNILSDQKTHPLPLRKYLPQTYVSASFLFALAAPEEIAALPKGLRLQKDLFPLSWSSKIPLDIDRYHSEKIYLASPSCAFISNYSNPATIDALKKQRIPLVALQNPDQLLDVPKALRELGEAIQKKSKANLLALFIESALIALDNRFEVLKASWKKPLPKILMLHYHHRYSIPTTKTLAGQLLQRAGLSQKLCCLSQNKGGWMIPVQQEEIARENPCCLIISTTCEKKNKNMILQNPAFQSLGAKKKGNFFFVDDSVQQFPSQYIVIAYFDIFEKLLSADL